MVLDTSVTMSWCFLDEADVYAGQVLNALRDSEAEVPAIWPLEVSNALLVGERRGRITAAESSAFLNILADLRIHIDSETSSRAFTVTIPLGRSYGLSSYDSAYLELAMRLGLPLATLDDELIAALPRAGVQRFSP